MNFRKQELFSGHSASLKQLLSFPKQVWFQNRRAKWRKKEKHLEPESVVDEQDFTSSDINMQSQQLFLSPEQNFTDLASAQAAINYSLLSGLQATGDQLINSNNNNDNNNQILNQNGQALPPGYYFVPFATQQAYASHQSAYFYDASEGDSNSTYEYLLKQQQQLAANYPLYVVQDPVTGLQHVFCAYDYRYPYSEQVNCNVDDLQIDSNQLFENKSDSEQDSDFSKSETSSNDSSTVTGDSNYSEVDSTSPVDSPNSSQFNSSNDDSQLLARIEPNSTIELTSCGFEPPFQIQEGSPSAHACTKNDFAVELPNCSSSKPNLHDLSCLGLGYVHPDCSSPKSTTQDSGSALECLDQIECSIDSGIKDKKISEVLASFSQFIPQHPLSSYEGLQQDKDSAVPGPNDKKATQVLASLSQSISQNGKDSLESLEQIDGNPESGPKDSNMSQVLASFSQSISENERDDLECLKQTEGSTESGTKDTQMTQVHSSFSRSISQNTNHALERLEKGDGTGESESEDTKLSQVLGSFASAVPSNADSSALNDNDDDDDDDDDIDFITANNFESQEDETNDYLENYVECLVSLEENLNRQTSFNESSIDETDGSSVKDGSEGDISKSLSDLLGQSEEVADNTQCNRVVIKDGLVYQVKSQDLSIQSHLNHTNHDIFDILLGCSDDEDCNPADSDKEQKPRFENDNSNRKRDSHKMEADKNSASLDSAAGSKETASPSDQSLHFTQDTDNMLAAGTIKRQRLSSLSLESCICASNEAYIEKSTFEDYLRFTDSVEYLGNIKQDNNENTEPTEFVVAE